MEKRYVVLIFLKDENGKTLLVKRSEKKEFYPGKWTGISGHVENNKPLESAYRELFEEVGLSKNDIENLEYFENVRIIDHDLNILWIVKPFTAKIKNHSILRKSEEIEDYKFFNESEIYENKELVPGTLEVYEYIKKKRKSKY